MLNKKQAKNIIKHLEEIIYDNIYIINTSGEVIASNVEEAIGSIDETAKIVCESRMSYIKNNEDDSKLYLPIFVDGDLVLVAGLNGSFNNIGKYGEFVVKITEILCKETAFYEKKAITEENRHSLIESIIFGNDDKKILDQKLSMYGYYPFDSYKHMIVISRVENNVSKRFDDRIFSYFKKTDLYTVLKSKYIIFTTEDLSKLKNRLNTVYKEVSGKFIINVSNKLTNDINIQNEYNKQTILNDYYSSELNYGIQYSDKVGLEVIIWDINTELRTNFVNGMFKNFNEKDLGELRIIIPELIRNNGRLDVTSKNLYIHINTLNYKINKLSETYGQSIRDYKVLMELYIALMSSKFKK